MKDEFHSFLGVIERGIRRSIRVNTLKLKVDELLARIGFYFGLEQIPWCNEGFFLNSREEEITSTAEYFLGYYYVQDAASMVPAIILKPNEDEIILDMCAAPGSKTTQLACMMGNKGLIVANDISTKRIEALKFNLQKLGVSNAIITIQRGEHLWRSGVKFDKILLDAPCSNSGLVVRDREVLRRWKKGRLGIMREGQKRLMISASKCIKSGGLIVYSTCSLDPEENEEIIDYAIRELRLDTEEIVLNGIRFRDALESFEGKRFHTKVSNAVRIYPQDNMTEGFFICALRK